MSELIQPDDNEAQDAQDGLSECLGLLHMANRIHTVVNDDERAATLFNITVIFECMANDETGHDGTWDQQEMNAVCDALRAAVPFHEKDVITRLVAFLERILSL